MASYSADSKQMVVKPEVVLLGDLLNEIAVGTLRVPRFQRPFVWRPEQMLDLFDSIERGYPVGSLLIWETSEPLRSLDQIGGIPMPEPPTGGTVSYLLDGHQRLSTLYGTLFRPRTESPTSEQRSWMWWVYRELGGGRSQSSGFRHWKSDNPPPPTYLPVRVLLRTLDFLGFARDLQARAVADSRVGDADSLIDEAEQIAQRVKSYKLAVVRLVGGSQQQAVEVFSRLNSTGQPMTTLQMVSALSYGGDASEDNLVERIELILEGLSSRGYSSIPSATVFRSILAVAGEDDVMTARWETLAERTKDRLSETAERTDMALSRAVDLLRDHIGVPLARLVPYNIQILLLAAYLDVNPEPGPEEINILRRWFWATSWSGFFASAYSTQVKNYLSAMREFARGRARPDGLDAVARPYPDRFDLRSARVRTAILWELQELTDRCDTDGKKIDVVELLEKADSKAFRHIVTSRVEGAQSPANRLVLPTQRWQSVRRALTDLEENAGSSRVVQSHGMTWDMLSRLRRGDDEGFIQARAAFLADREQAFMLGLGITPATRAMGDTDIDTE